ncbi:MAG: hypothetical protein RI897_2503 [Verrucomicrobiota bacterium]
MALVGLAGAPVAFVDELVEEHPGDHVEGFEDALALVGDAGETGHLHFAVIEQEFHIFDGCGVGEVPFVVLEDVGYIREVHAEGFEVFLHVAEALDVFGHLFVLGICDEDDAIDTAQDELAGGVVDDLAGDGIELEFCFEALDGHGFDGQEVEEERAVGAGGERDQFALFLGGLDILVDLDEVCGLAAHGGPVIDDLDLQFLGGLIDDCHSESSVTLCTQLGGDYIQLRVWEGFAVLAEDPEEDA